jgi:hypothetical protein
MAGCLYCFERAAHFRSLILGFNRVEALAKTGNNVFVL